MMNKNAKPKFKTGSKSAEDNCRGTWLIFYYSAYVPKVANYFGNAGNKG